MSIIIDSLAQALKTCISKPKANFDKTKSNIVKTLIAPASYIIGAEALVIGILGAIKVFRISAGGITMELAGAASDNMLILAMMIILSYFAALGSNLYYAHLCHKSEERLLAAASEINKRENFSSLVNEYRRYMTENKVGEARAIASWMMSRYPSEVEQHPDLVQSIAKDISRLQSDGVVDVLAILPKAAK